MLVAEPTSAMARPSKVKTTTKVDRQQQRQSASSSAGVEFAKVHHYLDHLYPPVDLQDRNALSRTDGYWPFVHNGKDPPQSLTYGEFDVMSLAYLLEEALSFLNCESWEDCVFTDIGSGSGRMVLAAAALHDWRLCRGVELLPGLHETAVEIASARDERILMAQGENDSGCCAAAVELRCGSFEDEYFGDSDILFSFSTCMNGETMELMAKAVRRQCRVGTIVITTDYQLPTAAGDDCVGLEAVHLPKIRCVKQIPTWCQLVGGECIAYVHQVVE